MHLSLFLSLLLIYIYICVCSGFLYKVLPASWVHACIYIYICCCFPLWFWKIDLNSINKTKSVRSRDKMMEKDLDKWYIIWTNSILTTVHAYIYIYNIRICIFFLWFFWLVLELQNIEHIYMQVMKKKERKEKSTKERWKKFVKNLHGGT